MSAQNSLYSPLTDVGRDDELDIMVYGVYLVATRHSLLLLATLLVAVAGIGTESNF